MHNCFDWSLWKAVSKEHCRTATKTKAQITQYFLTLWLAVKLAPYYEKLVDQLLSKHNALLSC
jgi:hypothetical protein